MNYLCNSVDGDKSENFGLVLLSYLLFDTPNSPLYKALIESELAPSFSPGNGYDHNIKEGKYKIPIIDKEFSQLVFKISVQIKLNLSNKLFLIL